MTRRTRKAGTPVVDLVVALALFALAWLYRYNDPEGLYAGLNDDHYFYLVRGWQLLYGLFPDRDFVDPGAPLHFVLSALAQVLGGRGTWSETVLSVTALSVGTAFVYVAARAVSGSRLIGVAAALFEVALQPRYYGFPKVLVYALAVPLAWRVIETPTRRRTVALAALTVLAFLLRHDHGAFVGLLAVMALVSAEGSWRERATHTVTYGLLCLLFVAPYLGWLQLHGGVVRHAAAASSWAARDRGRAPLVLPTLSDAPERGSDS